MGKENTMNEKKRKRGRPESKRWQIAFKRLGFAANIYGRSLTGLKDWDEWGEKVFGIREGHTDAGTIADWEKKGIPDQRIQGIAEVFHVSSYHFTASESDLPSSNFKSIIEERKKNPEADISIFENRLHHQKYTPVFFDPTQESKIDELSKIYLEREEVAAQIEQYLKNGEKCIYVFGEPGIGKSALSAYLIRKIRKEESRDVIFHFIGYSRKNWKDIVFALLEQIQMKFGSKLDYPIHLPDKTAELNDDRVRELYRQGLFSVSKVLENEKSRQKRLVIIIDALDELEKQSEKTEKNTCFQIVPCNIEWNSISFFVTSRSGDTRSDFLNYMGCKLPVVIELKRMDKAELEELAKLYKVSLNKQQKNRLLNISGKTVFKLTDQVIAELKKNRVPKEIISLLQSLKNKEYKTEEDFLSALKEKLGEKAAESHKPLILKFAKQEQSEGNFLYVTEILKRLQEDKDYDLSELPSTIIGFFRKELTEKFRIKDNDLLKQILAIVKVFKIHPSDQHFIQIIGREKKKEIESCLDQISCYLTLMPLSAQREKSVYPVFSKQ